MSGYDVVAAFAGCRVTHFTTITGCLKLSCKPTYELNDLQAWDTHAWDRTALLWKISQTMQIF